MGHPFSQKSGFFQKGLWYMDFTFFALTSNVPIFRTRIFIYLCAMKNLLLSTVFLFLAHLVWGQKHILVPFLKDGKFGYTDTSKTLIHAPEYDVANLFFNGYAVVCKDKKWGLITPKFKTKIPLQYDLLDYIQEGLYKFKKDGKFGLINAKGKILAAAEYDGLSSCSEGMIIGKKAGKFGVLNKKGNVQIPFEYTQLDPVFSDGWLLVVKQDSLLRFINAANETLNLPENMVPVMSFREGLAPVYILSADRKTRNIGIINTQGELQDSVQLHPFYQNHGKIVSGFSDGFFCVEYESPYDKHTEYYYVGQDGKASLAFSGVRYFSEGLAGTSSPFSYEISFVNTDFATEFKIEATDCGMFNYGLCPVKQEKGWCYINKTGEVVIPGPYTRAGAFFGPFAIVEADGQKFLVSQSGIEYRE